MKKYIMTSLLILIPAIAVAADHCTNPNEYTIDRRCYVSDEQKTKKPYSAVVKVFGPLGNIDCTGTIVKENNDYYVYTALKCVTAKAGSPDAFYRVYDQSVTVTLQNGKTFKVKRNKADVLTGEMAVYKFSDEDKKAIEEIAITETDNVYSKNAYYEAVRLVGYGELRIMSDAEIHAFKKAYEKHLGEKADERYGINLAELERFEKSGADNSSSLANLINDNDNLKESVCDYSVRYGADGCQGWRGNIGGPVFDNSGKIMAVVTNGRFAIAGDLHARVAGGKPGTSRAGSVSLLKEESSEKK